MRFVPAVAGFLMTAAASICVAHAQDPTVGDLKRELARMKALNARIVAATAAGTIDTAAAHDALFNKCPDPDAVNRDAAEISRNPNNPNKYLLAKIWVETIQCNAAMSDALAKTKRLTTTELNEICESTYQSRLDQSYAPSDLACTRAIIGIINTLDDATIKCLPVNKDIEGLIKPMVNMLNLTAHVDPRFSNLPADEAVYRYIHVQYCKDRRPR
jgi:hypothetical protein